MNFPAAPVQPMRIRGLYDNNLFPATFGGAERIFRLHRGMAQHADVRVLSLIKSRERAARSQVVDGIAIERRKLWYPTLFAHLEGLRLVPMHAMVGLHRWSGARLPGGFLAPGCVAQFDSFLLTALYPRVPAGCLKVYHAVNVETEWYEPMLRRLFARRTWERLLHRIEQGAVQGADLVLHVSERDGERLVQEFGARRERMLLVPNGFEPANFGQRDAARRARTRARLGIGETDRVAVFTGSAMVHNLDAARFLVEALAPAMVSRPEWKFLLVGDLWQGRLPANVRATGRVPEVPPFLEAADVAINPIETGSGTSLKVPEFLAAGLPLVSTRFGMRGFEPLLELVTLAERPGMAQALVGGPVLPSGGAALLERYAWDRQARRMLEAYQAWAQEPDRMLERWACIPQ